MGGDDVFVENGEGKEETEDVSSEPFGICWGELKGTKL